MRWRRGSRFSTAVVFAVLVGALGPGGAVATAATLPLVPAAPAGVPHPADATALPAGIEPLQPYVAQDSCDPTPTPGLLAFRQVVLATYPDTGSYGVGADCGTDGSVSEHYEGRAWDWAVSVGNPKQVGEVAALFHWLLATDRAGNQAANARRLGIMYIIWDRHILGTYRLSEGWRDYSCSGMTGCHQDHVHFSFSWAGARKATSYWTGRVAPVDYGPCRVAGLSLAPPRSTPNPTACPAVTTTWPTAPPGAPAWLPALRTWSGAVLRVGSTGPAVVPVQSALKVAADGDFGPITLAALRSFQTAHGLAASGVTDVATWRALLAAATGTATPPPPAPTPTPVPAGYSGPCSASVAASSPFTDIGGVHAADIACLAHYGIANGVTPGTFAPGRLVTRDQMATFLARLLTAAGVALPANAPRTFTDVAPGGVHSTAIGQLAALGVVQGVTGNTFDPGGQVTRAQMASFLARTWRVATGQALAPATSNPFVDVAAGDTHTADVLAVAAAGISQGRTATTFAPQQPVSREQMASFLARTLGLLARQHPVVPLAARAPLGP